MSLPDLSSIVERQTTKRLEDRIRPTSIDQYMEEINQEMWFPSVSRLIHVSREVCIVLSNSLQHADLNGTCM